jgi:hypothetical protein
MEIQIVNNYTMIIFLPGFSLKNKEEMLNISNALSEKGKEVIMHEWRHWDDLEIEWNPNLETSRVQDKFNTNKVGLIAKSLGTHIAMKVLTNNLEAVRWIILMGIPLNDLDDEEKAAYDLLKSINIPLFIIHNKNDSHGSWVDVEKFLQGAKYELTLKDSSDHNYNYPEDILQIVDGR